MLRNDYKEIFRKEILKKSEGIIFHYNPYKDRYLFERYTHSTEPNAIEKLAELMRHNLLFYAYGENEVIDFYNDGSFYSLEQAAKLAYKERLPKRESKIDGLPGETLLDLLIQLYTPDSYKLAVRTIYRQNDNTEIKGYDLTYFTRDESGITLWLGQAKLGQKDYCKRGINNDLLAKYTSHYLANYLFFLSDKPINITDDARYLLKEINKINMKMVEEDDKNRARSLLQYFVDEKIKIKVPCLLAYEAEDVYKSPTTIYQILEQETKSFITYYKENNYLDKLDFEIIFCIFPIKSLERLRSNENGFYKGLC